MKPGPGSFPLQPTPAAISRRPSAAARAACGASTPKRRCPSACSGPKTVLHNIDLDVASGETVVIIGAAGWGKTTLLRCINYLERPTSGTVYLDGRVIGRIATGSGRWKDASERVLAKQRRGIGFV